MADAHKISNKELIVILKEVLAAMEVKGDNRFSIRAYQNALSSIEGLTISVYDLWQRDRLQDIPGVGSGLAQHLNSLFKTGESKEFQLKMKNLPQGMFELIGLRGIGAKRAFKLAQEFKLESRGEAVDKLREFAQAGEIQKLEGFGEKMEKEILESINEAKMTKNEKPRMLLINAEDIAERIIQHMKQIPDVSQIEALGSLRRRAPTVGDIDLAVGYDDPDLIINHFLKFPEIHEVLVKGDKKVSVVLNTDTQVDLRVIKPGAFGSMVQYFTGNKQHNVLLRTYALENDMSLSEYGIKVKGELEEFDAEESFYKRLNLPWIPPEIRHGTDEIELSIQGKLPRLVSLEDIKGDIHTHTIASDGVNTLSEMVKAAKDFGYQYIGISDHAPSVLSRGIDEVSSIIRKTRDQIKNMSETQSDIKVLYGYEVNILADATLGLPDELLSQLDYVVASIHTSFNQDRDTVTNRLIKAIENPHVDIIGHPSGRLINERDPADLDWQRILDACKRHNKILEINSQPNRLDLTDDLVKEAVGMGIDLVINTDAHDIPSLSYMKYGIDVARRGYATRKNIINTLSLDSLLERFDIKP